MDRFWVGFRLDLGGLGVDLDAFRLDLSSLGIDLDAFRLDLGRLGVDLGGFFPFETVLELIWDRFWTDFGFHFVSKTGFPIDMPTKHATSLFPTKFLGITDDKHMLT